MYLSNIHGKIDDEAGIKEKKETTKEKKQKKIKT